MPKFGFFSDWRAIVFSSGASLFVAPTSPSLHETVTLQLRVQRASPLRQVMVYSAPDGEAWEQPMELHHRDAFFAYYQCRFQLHWKAFRYHFILITEDHTVWHYLPGCMKKSHPTIRESFVVLADAQLPAWVP